MNGGAPDSLFPKAAFSFAGKLGASSRMNVTIRRMRKIFESAEPRPESKLAVRRMRAAGLT